MEVIRLSGYTEDEKTSIAIKYLLPKQLKNNGVKVEKLNISDAAVRDIVRYYTREAGVRSLERELSKICRKVVKSLLLKQMTAPVLVTPDNLNDFLGVQKYTYGRAEATNQVGQVVGLAWTEVGGDLLTIEAALMPGKGVITRTGSLGDVMKESVEAARTVVRSRARMLGIKDDVFEKKDLHIHVPDGATPKDGPSAGAAMTTAMVSAMTGIPVRADVAMTGEITLRGEVTAIGGLKEKLLAALRGGIKTVLIPEDNVKDLQDIPENVKNGLEIVPVKWIDKVLEVALVSMPQALPDEEPLVVEAPVAADAKDGYKNRRCEALIEFLGGLLKFPKITLQLVQRRQFGIECSVDCKCGISSVGRAIPCQGIGREFEPLIPLQTLKDDPTSFCKLGKHQLPFLSPKMAR
jgi:ATP-dependent Lon protease